jgi:hyperosmotically inducible protein
MRKHIRVVVGLFVLVSGVAVVSSRTTAAQIQGRLPIPEIRKALLELPYYGVFDFMAFSYNQGTVTLMGYAYHPSLKKDAERAVKRVPGVDTVKDLIEELPPSPMDDELRWKTYYAIYTDTFLSRYAPGGDVLWGMRHTYPTSLLNFGGPLFPGMEPAGDYPIHIIVKGLRVSLFGVVDSEMDKKMAEVRAREVPGALGVENHLEVYTENRSSTR